MMEKGEAILHHTLEILCLLTVEDYIVVRREADGNKCSYSLCAVESHDGSLDSTMFRPEFSFHLLGVQDRNQKRILELANKIIWLLSCEVPLKCQDVAIYFSKDEWEYLEGHGEHYNYRRMGEARGDHLPTNRQNLDQRNPDQFRVKEEPDSGGFEEVQPAVSVGGFLSRSVKSEPRERPDEDMADRIHTESPQCLSSVISHTSEEPDEAYDARLLALEVQPVVGGFLSRPVKSEPIDCADEDMADRSHTESPQFLSCVISEEPDEAYDARLIALGVQPAAVNVGCFPLCPVKSEPIDLPDDDIADRIYTESPQCLSSDISQISEESDEAYDSQLIALDNENDQTMNSEIIYQLTAAKKRCRTPGTAPCELCGKKFVNQTSLARHLKMHSGEIQFSCETCGKIFSCRNHLVTHRRIHTGERPYSCEECGRKFTNHNHLVLHKVVHTKEKPFTCPVCGKGFTRQSSVVKHSGMHAAQKPHVCKECGKSYCQYANLVVHQRLHSGEKPFTCKHCEKGFICKATMIRHELTHTGERPFPCPQCDKCFADNSTLNKHKRRVHAKGPKKS